MERNLSPILRRSTVPLPQGLVSKGNIRSEGHEGYFIIEVKIFNKTDKVKHDTKFKDLLWQCIVYSYSDIMIPEGNYDKPLFVLYYIAGDGIRGEKYKEYANFLHHFVQRGGVGIIKFLTNNCWEIVFGGSRYYHSVKGKGPHNIGVKRMTGSSRWYKGHFILIIYSKV